MKHEMRVTAWPTAGTLNPPCVLLRATFRQPAKIENQLPFPITNMERAFIRRVYDTRRVKNSVTITRDEPANGIKCFRICFLD